MLPGLLRAMPREAVAARVAAAAVGGFDGRRNRMGLDPLFGELPVDDVMIGLAGRERPDVHQQEISYALGDALGLLDPVHAAQVDHLAAPGSPPRCSRQAAGIPSAYILGGHACRRMRGPGRDGRQGPLRDGCLPPKLRRWTLCGRGPLRGRCLTYSDDSSGGRLSIEG